MKFERIVGIIGIIWDCVPHFGIVGIIWDLYGNCSVNYLGLMWELYFGIVGIIWDLCGNCSGNYLGLFRNYIGDFIWNYLGTCIGNYVMGITLGIIWEL